VTYKQDAETNRCRYAPPWIIQGGFLVSSAGGDYRIGSINVIGFIPSVLRFRPVWLSFPRTCWSLVSTFCASFLKAIGRSLKPSGKLGQLNAHRVANVLKLQQVQSASAGLVLAYKGLRARQGEGDVCLMETLLFTNCTQKGQQQFLPAAFRTA
jgi:hypothetical protein